MKLLATYYKPKLKAICDPSGNPFIHVLEATICEFFNLEGTCDEKIVHEELEREF